MMVPLIIAASGTQESTKGIVVAVQTVLARIGLDFAPIAILAIIIVGLTLKAIVGVLVTRYVNQVSSRVTRDMRIRLVRSLLGARWGYFIRQPVGRLAFAIGPETEATGHSFEALTTLIASMLQVLVFVTVIALLSWQLLVIAIVVTGVVSLWFGGLVRQSRLDAKQRRQEARQRVAQFTDTLMGIKPIRAMGRAGQFADPLRGRGAQRGQGCAGPDHGAGIRSRPAGAGDRRRSVDRPLCRDHSTESRNPRPDDHVDLDRQDDRRAVAGPADRPALHPDLRSISIADAATREQRLRAASSGWARSLTSSAARSPSSRSRLASRTTSSSTG